LGYTIKDRIFVYLNFFWKSIKQKLYQLSQTSCYKSQDLIIWQKKTNLNFWIFQKYSFSRITFLRWISDNKIDSKKFLTFYSAHFGI
jgi:hypothetical protein